MKSVKCFLLLITMMCLYNTSINATDKDKPVVKEDTSWIHFPKDQKEQPNVKPIVVDTTKIKLDQLYIVDCDLDVDADVFPPGIALCTTDKGPIKIRGKFVDGLDKLETRTYAGKTVITVEPIQSGSITLLIVPTGKGKADWIKKSLTVESGKPTPIPDPTPEPTPTPQPVVVDQKLFIVYVEADGDKVNNRGVFISNPQIVSRIKDKGHKVRIVDKDVIGVDGQTPKDVKRFIDACTGKDYPQLFIVNQKGATLGQFDWNNNKQPDDLLKILSSFGG